MTCKERVGGVEPKEDDGGRREDRWVLEFQRVNEEQ